MTFKQLLFRYLKEKGHYAFIHKAKYNKKLTSNILGPIELLSLVGKIFTEEGHYWLYKGQSAYLFFKIWAGNYNYPNEGDIVTVETLDRKHTCDLEVFDFWHSELSLLTKNGCKISINRVKAINGKPVDFNNGWYLKQKFNE